jgi:hypothetical protein
MSGSFHAVRGMSETQTHDFEYFSTPTRCVRFLPDKETPKNYKDEKRKEGSRRALLDKHKD